MLRFQVVLLFVLKYNMARPLNGLFLCYLNGYFERQFSDLRGSVSHVDSNNVLRFGIILYSILHLQFHELNVFSATRYIFVFISDVLLVSTRQDSIKTLEIVYSEEN